MLTLVLLVLAALWALPRAGLALRTPWIALAVPTPAFPCVQPRGTTGPETTGVHGGRGRAGPIPDT